MSKLLRSVFILSFLVCMPILSNAQCTVNAGADYNQCIYPWIDNTKITGTVAGNFPGYFWASNGTGKLKDSTTMSPRYFHTAADIAAGSVTLVLTAYGGTCGSVTDQITITFVKLPSVILQNEFPVCGTEVPLTSTVVGSSTLQWSTIVGTGTFSTSTALNTTYSASLDDRVRRYILVTLSASAPASQCIGSDTVRVNILPAAIVDAGIDRIVCSTPNAGVLPMPTTKTTGFTSYAWTTSGSGTFINPDIFSTGYFLSPADMTSASVTITLTGSSADCGTASDSYTITVVPTSEVSAGLDQNICGNTASLSGTVAVVPAASVSWVNVIGTGTFTNNTTLTPTYTVSEEDKTRGYALVRMFVISTNNCSKDDTMQLNILSVPFVSAGSNKISCSGSVALTGASFNATSKTWTTSGTGTFANANKDTTTYIPSIADRNSGQVTLTYTASNSCSTVSSTLKIDFIASSQPQVNAGVDVSICSNETAQLSGTVVNAAGGNWSTTGSGTFLSSKSHLINQYIPSAADKIAGTVVFTLTSYNNGGCGTVSDQKTVTITSGLLPSVDAGPDQTSAISTPLNATVSNASSQLWETSGKGLFVPTPTSLTASYLPSLEDIGAESVVLTLVATSTCGNASDALTIFTATPSSITGTIKAGANTLDRGIVYLYVSADASSPRILAAMDTLVTADNGIYVFPSVAKGFYSVYAVPFSASTYATSYLATYFGSTASIQWEDAGLEEVINNSGVHVLNVDLIGYTSALPAWNTGHDTIAGAIFLNDPAPMMRLAGADDKPLSGVVVYLKTLNGQIITYTITNKYGAYTFNNVIQGNYLIDTEYSNTEIVLADKIVAVDGNSQTIEDGSVIVNKTSLTTGVVSSKKSIQINAYPNPASDIVHIQLPKAGNYSVKVLDEVGGLHAEQQLSVTSGETADITVLSLHKGLYIIQITSSDEVYTTKIVKF